MIYLFFNQKMVSFPNPMSVTFIFSHLAKVWKQLQQCHCRAMSMGSFCRPEACGATPSATLAPSQRWLLCPAGHTHCLSLSSYTTPKQTADHPQCVKKKMRKLSKKGHWRVTSSSWLPLQHHWPLVLHFKPCVCICLVECRHKCWHVEVRSPDMLVVLLGK